MGKSRLANLSPGTVDNRPNTDPQMYMYMQRYIYEYKHVFEQLC